MTSEEKMREDFEIWWSSEIKHMTPDAQMMANFAKGMYWHAWKASRESLVIDLPDYLADDAYNDAIAECIESIRAAGVKTR